MSLTECNNSTTPYGQFLKCITIAFSERVVNSSNRIEHNINSHAQDPNVHLPNVFLTEYIGCWL